MLEDSQSARGVRLMGQCFYSFVLAFHQIFYREVRARLLIFVTPPHCLKKNGTRAARHCARILLPHFSFIGRASAPLSPPTMTQWIPVSSSFPISSSKDSIDKNRTAAGAWLRFAILGTPYLRSLTLTSHQMWSSIDANLSLELSKSRNRSDRFVSTW